MDKAEHIFALCSSVPWVLSVGIWDKYMCIQGSRSWTPCLRLFSSSYTATTIRFSFPASSMDVSPLVPGKIKSKHLLQLQVHGPLGGLGTWRSASPSRASPAAPHCPAGGDRGQSCQGKALLLGRKAVSYPVKTL